MPDQNKAELYQEYLAAGAMQGTGLTFDQWLDRPKAKTQTYWTTPSTDIKGVVNPKTGVAMPVGSPDYRLFQKQEAEKNTRTVTPPAASPAASPVTGAGIGAFEKIMDGGDGYDYVVIYDKDPSDPTAKIISKSVYGIHDSTRQQNAFDQYPYVVQAQTEQAKLEESRRQADIANVYNQQNLAWQQQKWTEDLAWQKQQAAATAAQERQKWLTELSKSPSNWIQYYQAMYSKLPESPQWLSKYLPEQATGQLISPQNVATPSGQWLNQTAPTVSQGLQGYANWSAGQNKSQTWEDLMGNVNQMLPTSAPHEWGRWDATRKAGW